MNISYKTDFNEGLKAYYSGGEHYQLTGVLIRDVTSDERDLSVSYNRLTGQILNPKGLKLIALYLPIQQSEWMGIINEETE